MDVRPASLAPAAARPAPDGPAVDVRGLTKRFGSRVAVDGIDVVLRPGAICGFVGPNGAGKTTTIRMLLGLSSRDAGVGSVLGIPLDRPGEYLPAVGALIDGPAAWPGLTARENLLALAQLEGHEHRVDTVLASVGLSDRADDRVRGFSMGMRQRLGIAGALLPEPRLLVLDEPTNGLDPGGIREMRALLRALADGGTAILVSSHLLSEVQTICDDLLVVRDGREVFSGRLEDLLARQGPRLYLRAEHARDTWRLRECVRAAGVEAELNDDGEVVASTTPERAAELNRVAGRASITLAELRPEHADLEATFFALTGERERS